MTTARAINARSIWLTLLIGVVFLTCMAGYLFLKTQSLHQFTYAIGLLGMGFGFCCLYIIHQQSNMLNQRRMALIIPILDQTCPNISRIDLADYKALR